MQYPIDKLQESINDLEKTLTIIEPTASKNDLDALEAKILQLKMGQRAMMLHHYQIQQKEKRVFSETDVKIGAYFYKYTDFKHRKISSIIGVKNSSHFQDRIRRYVKKNLN